jgi:hypothetical protein
MKKPPGLKMSSKKKGKMKRIIAYNNPQLIWQKSCPIRKNVNCAF